MQLRAEKLTEGNFVVRLNTTGIITTKYSERGFTFYHQIVFLYRFLINELGAMLKQYEEAGGRVVKLLVKRALDRCARGLGHQ